MPHYRFEVVWNGESLGDAWVALATIVEGERMCESLHSAVPLRNVGMLAYGIIEPAEISILAKAVSDHCSIH
ncbi:hypothetical protein CK224_21255 [Mesorhizobium sp. WSM3862]|nr:hypothetical protein CK214_19035 [Mesorhizobium sp. WSM3882]PBB96801.1 hypothetical protein CK224_21255 [Mesorhizobium sp. WSM3862]